MYFWLVGPTINCVPSTLWYIYWWPIYFTFTPDIEWSKRLGEIKMACCKVCHGQLVACSVTWHQHCTKSKPANQTQSGASKLVPEHFFAGQKVRSIGVFENCVWPRNNLLPKDLETSWSFAKTLRSCIKNRLYTAPLAAVVPLHHMNLQD